MNRTLRASLITSGVLTLALLGCNSLLDNQPGVLTEVDEAGVTPVPTTPPTGTTDPPLPPPDGGVPPTDSGTKDSGDCPTGQQMCFGTCVSNNDPLYGCGAASCTPCKSTRSTMGCAAGKCIVTACDPGYADCNKLPGDGCETDRSKATSCGSCNAVCQVAAPLCAPAGGSFQCTNGCTADAPVNCGGSCVDPNTTINHCGGCNIKCPAPENSVPACAGGTCNFTCKAQFHACSGACVASTDPAKCGAACTPCPAPTGGVPTCVADTCGMQCPVNTRLCGTKCVAKTDATACGAACTVCPVPAGGGTATCVADTCGTTCPATHHLCGGACVPKSDPATCGAACMACPVPKTASAATCTNDACGVTACAAGLANCDSNPANGCEVTLATDPANCGVCGNACVAPQTCMAGTCQ